ncbi:class F sortase [Umezawaea sp. Da 62-37]|uniref:class F sortase n=1 Tax=Umezawaea sp. Da 62-37 TaxID=3075927 RepID=UPI0028F725CB|nr:class F sortase [Umezawaea sp. Da 62-37]WNV85115.1 class F sortase [Umezawaea sp. Da 62-37]
MSATAAGLALVGSAALVFGITAQHHAPTPPASAALPTTRPASGSADAPSSTTASTGPVLGASVPTVLDIPALGVHHDLITLGHKTDGTVEVPPLSDVAVPGWDRFSPTPGELGPAVILGHVDAATQGRGVFYSLGALRPGDTVSITRTDHSVAVFRVDGVDEYSKDTFPTLTVYGNTPDPQLRLITCGGPYDPETHNYLSNIVAFATLVDSHPAT